MGSVRHLFQDRILSKWFLLYFFVIGTVALGQAQSTTSNVLDQVIAFEKNRMPYQKGLDYYSNTNMDLPVVEELSFRTETDKFDYLEQRYQMRIKFNGQHERKAQASIHEINQEIFRNRQEIYLLNKMTSSYLELVKMYFYKLEEEQKRELLIVLEDRRMIYSKLLERGENFEIDKWMDNEIEIGEVKIDIEKCQFRKSELLKNYHRKYSIDSISFDNWISVQKLEEKVNNLSQKEEENYKIELYLSQENLAKAEYQLEDSKAKKWLDFLNVQYQGERNSNFENISLGAGFVIPMKSSQTLKRNEAQLDILEKETKTVLEKEESQEVMNGLFSEFYANYKKYQLILEITQASKLEEVYSTYQNVETSSPLDLANIREVIISNKLKETDLIKEVFLSYINLLAESGILVKSPIKNYLDENLLILTNN